MSIPSSSEEVATSAGRRPALSASSISRRCVARDRPVVGAGDLLPRQLVEGGGEALGQAAGVHEEDRGAVRADELEEARVDRGPDRAAPQDARLPVGDLVRRRLHGLPEPGHVLDRHLDPQVEGLLRARRRRSSPGAASRSAGPRRRPGSARPPRAAAGSRRGRSAGAAAARPPRAAPASQREVRPALRAHERVDLVHDHRVDRLQERPRPRGEDEEERLRRRDEDVRGTARHPRALLGRRVAGADRDLRAGAPPRRAGRPRGRCRRSASAGSARRRPRGP